MKANGFFDPYGGSNPGGAAQAARSNMRFQDRRVADLEARLLDPTTGK
ncbi:hypothetical protein Acor_73890 [Acrocarpospora corrugata]|uniref:Uncharacterized protein n=1 Tax=Acrocarpospora corrugata TaxID=35763 RepID=A0A5M3WE19_9ACTN|nr:hypothetical protein [Acrocarpospora corrugata]GES05321.1 hypothetical protein Acor_73890 [Acrocarpospora corrugata]